MIDNLTEAIAHYKERARNYIETLKPFGNKPMLEATKKYIARQQEFARKYEQLAAWLAELQERREADRWIPVSERLPEDRENTYWVCTDGEYQCQCRWTNVNPFWTNLKTDWHWCHFDIPQYQEVIAWKPLPKPYESEDM